jgi:hypothetical protein
LLKRRLVKSSRLSESAAMKHYLPYVRLEERQPQWIFVISCKGKRLVEVGLCLLKQLRAARHISELVE